MESHATHTTQPNGAKVEVGTVTHEGKEYSAVGSVIDHKNKIVIGYVSSDGKRLHTWDGQDMGELYTTGKAKGFHGTVLTCYAIVIDGYRYSGRNTGPGMVLKLRRK